MIYKKYFVLLFLALLPWCSLASFTFRASKMCKSKKYCDASKQMADSFKDFSLQFKNLASAAKILQTDLLILASYVGPVMGFLGVGLGVVAFVLDKQQKDEIKAAVEMLSKKMDVLAIRIHDSTKKIIAHIDVSRFHDKIAKKAEQIHKIYDDFMNERNEKNLNSLKRICAKKTPLDIFDRMEYHLKHDSDQILLSDKYTDEAFEAYHQMYALVETQLICFYHICEELIDANESVDIIENRNTLLVKRVTAIKNHFERINGTRMEKVWNVILPTEIDRWYNEYAQLKVTERKKKESSLKIANQLNADYKELGYKYDVGIIKNRKKEEKLYAFDCKPEICQIKNATDYVLWVTRRKPCPWRKKQQSATRCLYFQAELYDTYENDSPFAFMDAEYTLKRFMRNCKIKNGFALSAFRRKLRGDYSLREKYRRAKGFSKKRKWTFKFATEKPHSPKRIPTKYFSDTVFWAERYPQQPFDFMEAFCKPGYSWPNCVLTEEAFKFHRLTERNDKIVVPQFGGK